jgi:outer membrane PBP1 activator LpoA protein
VKDPGAVRGGTYRLVVRGELGDRFASVFEGMDLEPLGGTTVLTGSVADQTHLMGLIEQIQELGLELVSVTPAEE